MPITSLISPQIPFLRRYARVVSGSQAGGDAYVVTLLETLVADPGQFNCAANPREEIYRLFSRIWNAMPLNGECDPRSSAISMRDRRVAAITPLPRQAFLLTAAEGFDHRQAARILDVAPDEFDRLIERADREIAALMPSKVLIIEDEPIIAMDLESLLADLGHGVLGPARTHAEARAVVRAERPDLVIADICLADGSSGLEAANEIVASFSLPVVFVTAYPESLLIGKTPEPAFLISKPFRADAVKAIVSQALFFNERASLVDRRSA